MTNFAPIQRFEPLTANQWYEVYRCFTPVQAITAGLNFVDWRYGTGVIDERTNCVWTRQKLRVVLESKHNGYTASLSEQEDPSCPSR